LDDIKTVEYTLHPTFPDPVRLIKDKATRFALLSAGWGAFQINAKAILITGELIETNHNLRLGKDDWPLGTKLTNFDSTPERIIYENLFHEKYRWRKGSTLAKAAEVTLEKAGLILASFEKNNLVRRAYFQSLDGQILWGATAAVGILPRYDQPA
jgi:transcription initiation factor IIF auxiliary subunit